MTICKKTALEKTSVFITFPGASALQGQTKEDILPDVFDVHCPLLRHLNGVYHPSRDLFKRCVTLACHFFRVIGDFYNAKKT